MYTRLDSAHVLTTLERLEARIAERFPGAGLARVCADLAGIARQTRERATEIARPNMWLRAGVGLVATRGHGDATTAREGGQRRDGAQAQGGRGQPRRRAEAREARPRRCRRAESGLIRE